MKHKVVVYLTFALFLLANVSVCAQSISTDSVADKKRVITPVKPNNNTTLTPPRGTDEKIIERYLAGDTITAKEEARKDSLKRIYPHYPKLTDVTFGINIGDPIARILGQRYGGIDVSATLNMWNRLQPVFELGLGTVKETPDELYYTYKTPLSPYSKIGANYNFLYKKDSKYQLIVGVRLGFTLFKYEVTDVKASSGGYWQEQSVVSLTGNNSNAVWGELLAGLKVQLWKDISMGWQVKWHSLLSSKQHDVGNPWYIPGMGDRERHWSFGVNVYYTLPLSRSQWPKIDADDASAIDVNK